MQSETGQQETYLQLAFLMCQEGHKIDIEARTSSSPQCLFLCVTFFLSFRNHAIHKFFRKYAGAKTLDGRRAITPHQVAQMAPHLAEHLEVPPVLFKQVDVLCQRFDFDGSGVLDRKQCTVMFRQLGLALFCLEDLQWKLTISMSLRWYRWYLHFEIFISLPLKDSG